MSSGAHPRMAQYYRSVQWGIHNTSRDELQKHACQLVHTAACDKESDTNERRGRMKDIRMVVNAVMEASRITFPAQGQFPA
jgi:hypothetical protein